MKDVRDLGRKLMYADPHIFGLLECKGVIQHFISQTTAPLSYTFILKCPDSMSQPKSLRELLLSPSCNVSLSDRLKLAKDLTKSVSYIHTFGFVHKNITPENILIFNDEKSRSQSAFLVGFGCMRGVDRGTIRQGDLAWGRNLYRHPLRQGQKPEEDYIMQHDIYSLGVCLLELGLGQSFLSYNNGEADPHPAETVRAVIDEASQQQPGRTKEHLVSLARTRLPIWAGRKFSAIVETCLTCLDANNKDFGDEHEFEDEDGILVGVRYIKKV